MDRDPAQNGILEQPQAPAPHIRNQAPTTDSGPVTDWPIMGGGADKPDVHSKRCEPAAPDPLGAVPRSVYERQLLQKSATRPSLSGPAAMRPRFGRSSQFPDCPKGEGGSQLLK